LVRHTRTSASVLMANARHCIARRPLVEQL
jgi:hypothetical protein